MIMEIQIPKELPQFEDEKTLIIVCGGLEARAFMGNSGVLSEIFHVRAPEIHYSDKETRFTTNTGGRDLGMGGIVEPVEEKEETNFFIELKNSMKEAVEGHLPEKIYVLAPEYAVSKTIKSLPVSLQINAVIAARGNYLDKHPTEILKLIKDNKA